METTPCGLNKFTTSDTYNYSDISNNFSVPDELLARLGSHSSRFFDYSGLAKMASLGVTIDPRFTAVNFRLLGKGEWFFILVDVTVKNDIPKSGAKIVANIPSFFAGMHTQKLGSVISGRGVGGWISASGQVQAGTFSGSDSTLMAGERIQLAGWYIPKNSLNTIGIPSISDKSPFFSEYINMLSKVDDGCKRVNTNKINFRQSYSGIVNGGDAWLGGDDSERFFSTNREDFSLKSSKYGAYGDFAYIAITVTSRVSITTDNSGDITNKPLGNIVPNKYFGSTMVASPLESDNTGRISYSYISGTEIGISAVGKAGSGVFTIPAGTEFSVSGYYRMLGT